MVPSTLKRFHALWNFLLKEHIAALIHSNTARTYLWHFNAGMECQLPEITAAT
ncbi:predicted protein [Sclerotinia sclerotiorum 1980 UF-70]|uniref:Uncharacterized protein n=1 Tax=Sclerotinia sclerotiorum (strain ATCC 18683 / 1980 / Ss-1) TaxID=665079 RepID=A7ETS9_SCLS1|nr:predicted protein [Sclerotinia sclerotiorum 1980 UF-70]EDN92871.1 predicted protein [Sclerotinia sclerotiorum 1980 UF-70]